MELPAAWKAHLAPEQLTGYAIEYGTGLLAALAIFVIGKQLARIIAGIVERGLKRSGTDDTIVGFVGNIVFGLLVAFVVIASLSQLGIETTSLAAIFAAAGLAIGLALQGSLSNFASGVLLIAIRPFKVGDFVEVGGTSGSVEKVSLFSTYLKSPDNKVIIVPNGQITDDTIVNYSAKPTRRIDLVFGIGYGDDMRQAKDIIKSVIAADERLHADPEPLVVISELGDNSVNITVRVWADTGNYWPARFDMIETVKRRFDEEGISIPFPQRDVWLHKVDDSPAA